MTLVGLSAKMGRVGFQKVTLVQLCEWTGFLIVTSCPTLPI